MLKSPYLTTRNSSQRAVQPGTCIPFINTRKFRYCRNLSEISSDTSGTFVAISVVCHATEDSELRNLHYVLDLKAAKRSSVTEANEFSSKVLRIQGVYLATLCKPGVSAKLVHACSLLEEYWPHHNNLKILLLFLEFNV